MENKVTKKADKGFSLVEIMVVIVIMALLLTLGVPGYIQAREKARRDTCVNNLRMIEHAADQYRIDRNLSTSVAIPINVLWPASSGIKDVSSYIAKQLKCPSKGSYGGGDNQVSTSYPEDASDDMTSSGEIEANGVPHCYETEWTKIYNWDKRTDSPDLVHSLEYADSLQN